MSFKKIISILIIVTYIPVSTLFGLDFAKAEAKSEADQDTSQAEIITEASGSETSQSEPSQSSYQPVTPEEAATPRTTTNWVSDIRVPIAFNSLKAFQADPFTGAATFSVPITVPPGRSGIQPGIALAYSSSGSNGICGQGWNLDLGAIERSTKKGVPSYNNSDTFVFISGGATTELVDVGLGHYRAKIESAFMDFYFDGTYWQIKDKGGSKYFFGQTSASRIEGAPGIFRWAIDKVSDINKNYMSISYLKDNNQLYPELIKYTAFNNDENFLHGKVEFIYESRNDISSNYRPKFLIKTTKRLTDIIVKTAADLRIRKYHFNYTYTANTNRSSLTSVTQYADDDSKSLPALTFTYQQSNAGWTQTSGWNIPASSILDEGARIADINNDGFVDILRYKQSEEHTFLHTQSNGWSETTNWQLADFPAPNWSLTFWGVFGDEGAVLADINGDGWLDLAQHFLDARTYEGFDQNLVFYNNKTTGWDATCFSSGCIPPYIVKICGGYTEFWGTVFSDVNGDGLADVVNAKNGFRTTWLNKINIGSGWVETPSWVLPDGDFADGAELADINADGLPDLVIAKDADRRTFINNGSNWVRDSSWDLPTGKFTDRSTQLIDVNADGLADLLIAKDSTRETYTNNGLGWTRNTSWDIPEGDFSTLGTRLADVNADGLIDIIKYYINETPKVFLNNGPAPDLLTGVNNGVGGTVSINYQPSTKFDNRDDSGLYQLPFPVYVVTSITSNDGQGNSYTTTNSYAKGKYDAPTREFRGFGLVQATDAEGNISETQFLQDDIFKGRPYKQIVKDSLGNIYSVSKTSWTYQDLYSGTVKFPYVSDVESFTFNANTTDENAFAKKTQATNSYVWADNLISQTTTIEKGDVTTADNPDDNRKAVSNFLNNETDWLIGFQNNVALYDGQNNKISEKRFYYDDSVSSITPPTKGQLTKEEAWLHSPLSLSDKNIAVNYSYNPYGQLQTTTDALTHPTTTTYDTELNTYPVLVTNAINHTVQSTYDTKTGQVLTSTDPNAQVSTNIYDDFGRLIKVIGPKDDAVYPAVIYEYDLSTTPIKITKRTKINYNILPDYIVSYSFFDGLGRLIEAKSPAENDPQTSNPRQIVSGIVKYNSRGAVCEKYLPYFVDSDAANFIAPTYSSSKITFTYDTLGRAIQTTNPDLTYSTVSYSDWTITKTDENNHSKKECYDAFGNLVQVDEHNNGQTYTTTYEYDIQKNLTKLTDAQSNISTITYDSLGRKVAMHDPDMGEWNYVYDDAGNLIKQTDAKSQQIIFNYDAINRLAAKTIAAKAVDYTYDEAAVNYSTGRLTKVNDTSGNTKFKYDNLGRETESIKSVNDEKSAYTVTRTYDALDRLVTVTYPDSEVVSYEYNKAGLIKRIASQRGDQQKVYLDEVNYNAQGQITDIKYGNATHTHYTYNPNTLRLTHFVTYGPSGATLQSFDYQFDNAGNVSNIIDHINNSTQSFIYDDLDRLIQASGSKYGTINYAYDSIGNMTQKGPLSLTYDGNIAPPHAVASFTGPNGTTNITYDANGNMQTKGSKQFFYDEENRLIKVKTRGTNAFTSSTYLSPGWNLFSLPVIPDDLKITEALSSISGQYDQVSRYKTTSPGSCYTLSDSGIRSCHFQHFVNDPEWNDFDTLEYGKGYQVHISNPQGCYLTVRGQIPENSDSNLEKGWNLISSPTVDTREVPDALNNLSFNVDYDEFLRYNKDITSFQKFLNNPATNEFSQVKAGESYYIYSLAGNDWQIQPENFSTTFEYDGDGGRVRKTTPTGTTTYVGSLFEIYIPDSMLDRGKTTKHIFMGSQRICSVESSARMSYPYDQQAHTYYSHSDHLGSSNVITDETGAQVALYEYSPYGEEVTSPSSQITNYQFTGKESDESTGLYFYGARYYDPTIGRFITPDTIVQSPYNPQSLNRYSYCLNNPLNYTDPTGHFWFLAAIFAIIKAAAVGAVIGAALGGVINGISAAIQGVNIFQGIGYGIFSGLITGAVGGAAWGFGAVGVGGLFGAKALSFWGTKLALGAFSCAIGGGAGNALSGASFGQGAMWGAVTGLVGTGIGISPIGQGIGKAIGNTGVGRALNSANNWVGKSINEFLKEAHGGSATAALSTNKSETVSNGQALSGKKATIDVRITSVEGTEKVAQGGETVYRQWGGEASPNGQSWSPENPAIPGYENRMGIPTQPGANTGQYISKGTLNPGAVYTSGQAPGIGTNTGGGTEYGIQNPQKDVKLDWIHMPDDK
jgi:RHS repeat-associated protein